MQDHLKELPTELILHIFTYIANFSSDSPSVSNFAREPSSRLTRSADQPLKILSSVCQRWRNLLLPVLFKSVCVTLDPQPRWLCLCTSLVRYVKGYPGRSAHAERILKHIEGTERFPLARDSAFKNPENPLALEYVEDDDHLLLSLPGEYYHWVPSVRGGANDFMKFIVEKELQSFVKSLVVYTDRSLFSHRKGVEETRIVREVGMLWKAFFDILKPSRLVVAAPPSTMSALTSSREDSVDTWAFEIPLQYLGFTLSESDTSERNNTDGQYIYNIRPWTHMSYNEGTMIKGYAHYEWQWKVPPRVLMFILRWIHKDRNTRNPKLQSMEYISLFPYANHVELIMQELAHLEDLRKLNVKFADPDILEDTSRLGKGQTGDVWTEWENSYIKVIRSFLRHGKEGTVFTSDDAKQEKLRETILTKMQKYSVHGPVGQHGPPFLRMEEDPLKWVRLTDPKGWGSNE